MSQRHLDLTGKRFGKLVALHRGESQYRTVSTWVCKCDCGEITTTRTHRLMSGATRSCGCLRRELSSKRKKIHGVSHTITGSSWNMMLNRCFNKKIEVYKKYGARGITVCEFIRATPVNLIFLIGERPSQEYSIDRIDGTKNYSCGACAQCLSNEWRLNVRWATVSDQNRNRSSNRNYTIKGVTMCSTDWSSILSVDRHQLVKRLSKFEEGRNIGEQEAIEALAGKRRFGLGSITAEKIKLI